MVAVIRIIFCVVWSIFWITLSVFFFLITLRSKVPVAMARAWWSPGILWICGIRLKVVGQVRDLKSSHIYVSNHQSYLDIPILFRSLSQNLYFVAKKEIQKIPFLGWYMLMTGMIFIDRTNHQKSIHSLNKAAKLIHEGKSVLMFPEGTRSSEKGLTSFKKGPFKLAQLADVSIIPIGIRSVGAPFEVNRLGKTTIEVHIGHPKEAKEISLEELISEVRKEVSSLSDKPILATV